MTRYFNEHINESFCLLQIVFALALLMLADYGALYLWPSSLENAIDGLLQCQLLFPYYVYILYYVPIVAVLR